MPSGGFPVGVQVQTPDGKKAMVTKMEVNDEIPKYIVQCEDSEERVMDWDGLRSIVLAPPPPPPPAHPERVKLTPSKPRPAKSRRLHLSRGTSSNFSDWLRQADSLHTTVPSHE